MNPGILPLSLRLRTMALAVATLLSAAVIAEGNQQTCAGDCNGNANVVVSELIIGITGLLFDDPSNCPSFDVDQDGTVDIVELTRAHRNHNFGCDAPVGPGIDPQGAEVLIVADTKFGLTAGTSAVDQTIPINFRLQTNGLETIALQFNVSYGPETLFEECEFNEGLPHNLTGDATLPHGCTPGTSECSGERFVVFSGPLVEPIPDNSVLFTCTVRVRAGTPIGRYPIEVSQTLAASPLAEPLPTSGVEGAILLSDQRLSCVGDCNLDEAVSVAELIRGVSIALGRQPVEQCKPFDANGSGSVSIEELITAVRRALEGCTF